MVERYRPPEGNNKLPVKGNVVFPHQFKSGHPKRGGRQKGTPHRTTTMLKQAILFAGANVGTPQFVFDKKGKLVAVKKGDGQLIGYLEFLAMWHPSAFAMLLARVLPLQVTGEGGGPIRAETITVTMTLQEASNAYQATLKEDDSSYG